MGEREKRGEGAVLCSIGFRGFSRVAGGERGEDRMG